MYEHLRKLSFGRVPISDTTGGVSRSVGGLADELGSVGSRRERDKNSLLEEARRKEAFKRADAQEAYRRGEAKKQWDRDALWRTEEQEALEKRNIINDAFKTGEFISDEDHKRWMRENAQKTQTRADKNQLRADKEYAINQEMLTSKPLELGITDKVTSEDTSALTPEAKNVVALSKTFEQNMLKKNALLAQVRDNRISGKKPEPQGTAVTVDNNGRRTYVGPDKKINARLNKLEGDRLKLQEEVAKNQWHVNKYAVRGSEMPTQMKGVFDSNRIKLNEINREMQELSSMEVTAPVTLESQIGSIDKEQANVLKTLEGIQAQEGYGTFQTKTTGGSLDREQIEKDFDEEWSKMEQMPEGESKKIMRMQLNKARTDALSTVSSNEAATKRVMLDHAKVKQEQEFKDSQLVKELDSKEAIAMFNQLGKNKDKIVTPKDFVTLLGKERLAKLSIEDLQKLIKSNGLNMDLSAIRYALK